MDIGRLTKSLGITEAEASAALDVVMSPAEKAMMGMNRHERRKLCAQLGIPHRPFSDVADDIERKLIAAVAQLRTFEKKEAANAR